jgi:hypothetical protein
VPAFGQNCIGTVFSPEQPAPGAISRSIRLAVVSHGFYCELCISKHHKNAARNIQLQTPAVGVPRRFTKTSMIIFNIFTVFHPATRRPVFDNLPVGKEPECSRIFCSQDSALQEYIVYSNV